MCTMLPGSSPTSNEGTCARPAIDFRFARFSWMALAMAPPPGPASTGAAARVLLAGERVAGGPVDGQPGLVEQMAVGRIRLKADGVMHVHRAVSVRLDREQI